MMTIIHSLKSTVPFSFTLPLLSLAVTHCYSLPLFVTHFHSLSLVVIRCHSLYHLLSLVVPLVFIRCHSFTTRCHSLSLVVTLVVTRCHSQYHSSVFFRQHTNAIEAIEFESLYFWLWTGECECLRKIWSRTTSSLYCRYCWLVLLNLLVSCGSVFVVDSEHEVVCWVSYFIFFVFRLK